MGISDFIKYQLTSTSDGESDATLRTHSLRRHPHHPCHSCACLPFLIDVWEDCHHPLNHLHSRPLLPLLQVCLSYPFQQGQHPCILRNLLRLRRHHRHPDRGCHFCLECLRPKLHHQLVYQQLSWMYAFLKAVSDPFMKE